jgi:hypothetical protein
MNQPSRWISVGIEPHLFLAYILERDLADVPEQLGSVHLLHFIAQATRALAILIIFYFFILINSK